jgi:hypothetical protein
VRPEGLGQFKNSPHRVLNPLPSGLQHSALTTTLPRAPNLYGGELNRLGVRELGMLLQHVS